MELNTIKLETTWSDAATRINANNQKIGQEIDKLKQATYKNKGYFTSVEALASAYPTSTVGSIAYVGRAYPYAIYIWDTTTKAWVDSGETGGGEAFATEDYYTKEETRKVVEDYHVVLTQEEYDSLEIKEDKLYFCTED